MPNDLRERVLNALKTLLFTVLVPGTVAGLFPYLLIRYLRLPLNLGAARWLGLLPLAVGIAIYLWTAYDFIEAGRGSPAPTNAPIRLVVRGLYRYTRNPMYIGVLNTLLGLALLFGSVGVLLYLLLVFISFHAFVLVYEEPTLRELFGKANGTTHAEVLEPMTLQ